MPTKQKSTPTLMKILRFISFIGGLIVLAYGVFAIGFGQCHDRGGFCAGDYQQSYYVIASIAFLISGLMFGFTFTKNIRKTLITSVIFLSVAVLWAIISEFTINS